MPTRSGEPRRVATHSPGKYLDLKASAKAPSCEIVQWLVPNIVHIPHLFPYQLNNDLFHQFPERVVRVLHVQVMNELGDDLRVSFALENISALLQEGLDVLVVGDDSIVDDHESVFEIRAMGMRVGVAWRTVSGPTGVGNADVTRQRRVDFLGLHLFRDGFLKDLHLAGRLDQQNVLRVIGVDGNAGRVIAAIFQSLESGDEAFENLTTGFRCQVVEICKNTCPERERETRRHKIRFKLEFLVSLKVIGALILFLGDIFSRNRKLVDYESLD
jgi:hypothetical protein